MKHVRESLREFYDYKFFSLFEEEEAGTDKETLKSKEQDALKIVDKITKDFEDFKKDSGGEILRFKEFWEENQQTKKQFTEPGDVYKLFGSDYAVGTLELPVKTLSDGSIEGGLGATDEPEEEIIEGKEVQPKKEFFEEQMVPNPAGAAPAGPAVTNEAEEGDDLDLDLNLGDEAPAETPEEGGDLDLDLDLGGEAPAETPAAPPAEAPAEEPEGSPVEEPAEAPMEQPMEEPERDLNAPQVYLVVYNLSGGEKEEIFRCGSNNAVKAFTAFYNDIFKGSMKTAIADYKKQKEQEKIEAEKAEKAKAETEKASKVKKFLGEAIEDDEEFNRLNDPANYDINQNIDPPEEIEDEIDEEDDEFDTWLEEVAEYLATDFEVESEDIETFMDISMDELQELFDNGESAFDASGIVAANEETWAELERLREELDDEE
jgi:hypothetical protein